MANKKPWKAALGTLAAGTLCVGLGGAAWAVSAGGYNPSQQDCPTNAEANNAPNGYVSPGCHNTAANVEDGSGNRYAEVGLDQLPNGGPAGTPTPYSIGYPGNDNSPHSGCVAVNTDGTGGGTGRGCGNNSKGLGFSTPFDLQNQSQPPNPTLDTGTAQMLTNIAGKGLHFYFGMDDNSDAGEHDGVSGGNGTAGSVNGASDGGGVGVYLLPQNLTATPTPYNPVAFAGAFTGFCADGFCGEATTSRQTVYQGCSPADNTSGSVKCTAARQSSSRNAYDYSGKKWDPYNCSSGDKTSESPKSCNATMDSYRQTEAHNVYAEPGVQVYEDPDPQGSPTDPIYDNGVTPKPTDYPLPAAYAGTCGVVVGGGTAPAPPAGTPGTNRAHQVAVTTPGC